MVLTRVRVEDPRTPTQVGRVVVMGLYDFPWTPIRVCRMVLKVIE